MEKDIKDLVKKNFENKENLLVAIKGQLEKLLKEEKLFEKLLIVKKEEIMLTTVMLKGIQGTMTEEEFIQKAVEYVNLMHDYQTLMAELILNELSESMKAMIGESSSSILENFESEIKN